MQKSPLAGVDANLLVALDALLAEENVARAGRRVGLSASATSHALARVRALLGDPLLVRAGRRMVPTARARQVRTSLHDGLELVARALAREAPLDLGSERRTLRIAAVDLAQSTLVPGLVRLLARDAPLVDTVVIPFGNAAPKALADGEIDVAFAAARRVNGTRSLVVHEERFVCLARAGHPLFAGRLTPRRFAALHHVLIAPHGRSPGAVDKALEKHGLTRRVALVVPTFLAAAKTLARSDLVLTCGASSAEEVQPWLGLAMFAPPLPLEPFRLGMYWHERQEHDPFLAWVRERVRELLDPGPQPTGGPRERRKKPVPPRAGDPP